MCVALGAAVGAVIELVVVRRLFDAPRVLLLVATIGVSQLLLFAQASLPDPTACPHLSHAVRPHLDDRRCASCGASTWSC